MHVPGKEIEGQCWTITVHRDMKSACLAHLARFHDIRKETMYNDLIGHIQNEQNFRTAETAFYGGRAKQVNKNHTGALGDYDEAIRLRPEYAGGVQGPGHRERYPRRPRAAITIGGRSAGADNPFGRYSGNLTMGDHTGAAGGDYDEAIRLRPREDGFSNGVNAKCPSGMATRAMTGCMTSETGILGDHAPESGSRSGPAAV